MRSVLVCALISILPPFGAGGTEAGKHLFILSGQSNMVGMDPDVSFTPAVD